MEIRARSVSDDNTVIQVGIKDLEYLPIQFENELITESMYAIYHQTGKLNVIDLCKITTYDGKLVMDGEMSGVTDMLITFIDLEKANELCIL